LERKIVTTYNPFRYRGYYYDTETQWYYLQTRYYNPSWGRFINADSRLCGYLLGYNLFAYCNNAPITLVDFCGEDATRVVEWIIEIGPWIDGPLPIADILLCVTGGVLFTVVQEELVNEPVEGSIYSPIIKNQLNTKIYISQPLEDWQYESTPVVDVAPATTPQVEFQEYDPNPYKRAGQKKQGRENRNKSRTKPQWKSRNNRRDGKPAKPKKHTPSNDHRRFSTQFDEIIIFG